MSGPALAVRGGKSTLPGQDADQLAAAWLIACQKRNGGVGRYPYSPDARRRLQPMNFIETEAAYQRQVRPDPHIRCTYRRP